MPKNPQQSLLGQLATHQAIFWSPKGKKAWDTIHKTGYNNYVIYI